MSFHASSFRLDERNRTRLEPPAREVPGPAPSGAGIGAVAQERCISGGSLRRNSPMFQGPVIHIANVPRPNSWYTLPTSDHERTGERESRKRET